MPAQPRIRPMRTSDLDRILAIERASFGPEAYDRKLFADYRARCGPLFLVAELRGVLCGYMITSLRREAAELVSVAVAPPYRRAQAASGLLEATLRRLRRRRVSRLHLVVRAANRPAQAFYRKYGFRRLRPVPGYYEDGGDGILMSRAVYSE